MTPLNGAEKLPFHAERAGCRIDFMTLTQAACPDRSPIGGGGCRQWGLIFLRWPHKGSFEPQKCPLAKESVLNAPRTV